MQVYISWDKSFCKMHKYRFKFSQRVAEKLKLKNTSFFFFYLGSVQLWLTMKSGVILTRERQNHQKFYTCITQHLRWLKFAGMFMTLNNKLSQKFRLINIFDNSILHFGSN